MARVRGVLRSLRQVVERVPLRMFTIVYAGLKGVTTGPGTIIHPGARLSRRGGRIIIGARSEIHAGALLLAYGGKIELGDDVTVNPYSVLYGHGGLTVGNDVRIATHVVMIPANHSTDAGIPIHQQPQTMQGIEIGPDVWIAAGARILDGARIAPGCVIAAGAVVTPSLTTVPNGIYGGVPARPLGCRRKRGN